MFFFGISLVQVSRNYQEYAYSMDLRYDLRFSNREKLLKFAINWYFARLFKISDICLAGIGAVWYIVSLPYRRITNPKKKKRIQCR
jgi:hypothetical protein